MRSFCEFLVDLEWLSRNPARKVRAPRDTSSPTLPFTPDEVKALIDSIEKLSNNNRGSVERARVRARGLVLLLLYSGMRIGDAVKLERSRLGPDGRLLVRMMKTGEPLYVKLGKVAVDALRAIPEESRYFLWSGSAALATAIGSARRTIDCLGKLAGVNAHPHRFRDTFSVELLKSGAALRTVQLLLGHTSIRTTERYYAPWVGAFQDQLDTATAKLKFG
jgi:site-specific recombinase XerD